MSIKAYGSDKNARAACAVASEVHGCSGGGQREAAYRRRARNAPRHELWRLVTAARHGPSAGLASPLPAHHGAAVEAPMRPAHDRLIPSLKTLLPARRLGRVGRAVSFIRRLREIRAGTFV